MPDQLSELAKQGLLGFLLVLAIGALIYLYKSREKLQAARMADWKEIADRVRENSMATRDWVAANESRTRAIEGNARAVELSAVSHSNLASEVARLSESIKEVTQSSREVREALLARGVNL